MPAFSLGRMGPLCRLGLLCVSIMFAACGALQPPTASLNSKLKSDGTQILFSDPDAPTSSETGSFNHFVQMDNVYMPSPSTGGAKTSLQALLQSSDERLPKSDSGASKPKPPDNIPPIAFNKPSEYPTGKPETPKVQIVPPYLDFQDRPISIPAVQLIEIINMDEKDLHIVGVTTDSMSFHSSFLKRVVVPPRSNMSMSVVFLPRNLGQVDNSLVISTSAGTFVYQVAGRGIPCPYRIQPLVGVKVPVNVRYEPAISIYNPHNTVLRVREIFTSGGFLHLTLPEIEKSSVETNMSNGDLLWDIPPRETRTLIRLDFSSATAGKYQGFVNIKTNVENMILHVEVVVVKSGIHRTPEELDFGTITSMHDRRSLELSVLNGGSSTVYISDLQPAIADSQLALDFSPRNISAKSETVVASISYTGSTVGAPAAATGSSSLNANGPVKSGTGAAASQQQLGEYRSGKLLLRTNDSNPVNARIEVPYRVRVLQGGLGYHPSNTTFPANKPGSNTTRDLVLTNKFSVPLLIYSVEIEHPLFDLITEIPFVGNASSSRSILVESGSSLPSTRIVFMNPSSHRGSTNAPSMFFSTSFILNTNASSLVIPLTVYSGTIDVLTPRGGETDALAFTASADQMDNVRDKGIDFGIVGLDEIKIKTVNITNRNPVPVTIHSITTTVDGLAAKLEGIWNSFGYLSSNGRDMGKLLPSASKKSSKGASTASTTFSLDPGHSAILSLELIAREEKEVDGLLKISTSYEELSVKLVYQSLGGAFDLWPLSLNFETGSTQRQVLTIQNGFSRPLTITSVDISDSRLQVHLIPGKRLTLASGDSIDAVALSSAEEPTSTVGPAQNWPELNSPLPAERSSIAREQEDPEVLPPIVDGDSAKRAFVETTASYLPVVPSSEVNRLQKWAEEWRMFPNGLSEIRATLTLRTDIAVVSRYPVSVSWPFPTLLGKDISLRRFGFGAESPLKESRSLFIQLENPLKDSHVLAQFIVSSSDVIPGVSFPPSSAEQPFLLLGPGARVDYGPITLDPSVVAALPYQDKDVFSIPLHIRNNLTVLETVQLEFRVARAALALIPDKMSLEGSDTAAVHMTLNASQLEEAGCCCSSTSTRVKLVNRGNVPLDIDRMGISGAGSAATAGLAAVWNLLFSNARSPFSTLRCSGFGFSVSSSLCSSQMRLAPLGEMEIQVNYAPDFSAARISRDLVVETVGYGDFRFQLEVTLPEESVSACIELLAAETESGAASNFRTSAGAAAAGVNLASGSPPPFLVDYLFQGYSSSAFMRPAVVFIAIVVLLGLTVIAFRDFNSSGAQGQVYLVGEECGLSQTTHAGQDATPTLPEKDAPLGVEQPPRALSTPSNLTAEPTVPESGESKLTKREKPSRIEPAPKAAMEPTAPSPPPVSVPVLSKKQQKKAAKAAALAAVAAAVESSPVASPAPTTAEVVILKREAQPEPAPTKSETTSIPVTPVEVPQPVNRAKSEEKKKVPPKVEAPSKPESSPKPKQSAEVPAIKPSDKNQPEQRVTHVAHVVAAPQPAQAPVKPEVKAAPKKDLPTPSVSEAGPQITILKKDPKDVPKQQKEVAPAAQKTPPSPTKATSPTPAVAKQAPEKPAAKVAVAIRPAKEVSKEAPAPATPAAPSEPITLLKKPAGAAKPAWAPAGNQQTLKYVAVDPEKKKLRAQNSQQPKPASSSSSSGGSSSDTSPTMSANGSLVYSQSAVQSDADPAALVEQLYMLHQQQQQQAADSASIASTAAELASALQQLEAMNQRNANDAGGSFVRGRGRGYARGSDRPRRGAYNSYHQQPQAIYKRKSPAPENPGQQASQPAPNAASIRSKGASWPSLPQLDGTPLPPQQTTQPAQVGNYAGAAQPYSDFYLPSPYASQPQSVSAAPDASESSGIYGIDDFAASLYSGYGINSSAGNVSHSLASLLSGPPRPSSGSIGPVGIIGSGIPASSRVAAIWERLPGVNSNPSALSTGSGSAAPLQGPIPLTPAIGSQLDFEEEEYYGDDPELEATAAAAVPVAFADDDDYFYSGKQTNAAKPAGQPSSGYDFGFGGKQLLPSPPESPRESDSFSSLFSSLPFFSGKPFFSPLFSSAESQPTQVPATVPNLPPTGDDAAEESSLFSGTNFIPPTMKASAAAIRRASVGSASSRPRSTNSSFSDLDAAVDDVASNGSLDE